MVKVIKNLLFILLVLVLQLAVIPNLPSIFNQINAIVITIVFVSILFNFNYGIVYTLIFGFLMDIYTIYPFAVMMLAYFVMFYFIYQVFSHFLTNKSFYSLLVLTGLAIFIFNFIGFVYQTIFIFQTNKELLDIPVLFWNFVNDLIPQFLVNIIIATFFFFVFHVVTRRFKAVFIDTSI